MRYVSLFSGVEAASVAWMPLGFEAVAFSEIDPFPCAVLAERFPDVPNLGDISKIDWGEYAGSVDIVVGGSPCQAFSVAGRRQGLLDQRGLLMLEYVRAVRELHPKWLLWENVPGVFSQSNGDAFDTFQRELEQCGYSLAWRTLDAQFFGVAQRRRRCFLVGHSDIGCAASVLFERESLRWDCQTVAEKRKEVAAATGRNAEEEGCYCLQGSLIGRTDNAGPNGAGVNENLSFTLNTIDRHAIAFDTLAFNPNFITSKENKANPQWNDPCHTLSATGKPPVVICVADDTANAAIDVDVYGTLKCGGAVPYFTDGIEIRSLMPIECERLQGFPDNWTQIPWRGKPASECPDGPRYKALGNSMAVPVMLWIGERIKLVEELTKGRNDD